MRRGVERGLLRSVLELRRTLSPSRIRRKAWEDGLLGGDRRWLAVGAVVWTFTLAGRAWRRQPEVVYRTKLTPGESVVVTTSRPPTTSEAKLARRAKRRRRS